ncbi:hypothetical protein EG349_19770 (plasmid) [Chryseobacterium shandongense]|jgi:hypothetical protein|uniref:Uncharacterized protein n=1 Tax=Chryseobacterium shandongense TaxID=1493872 RepID=A0AAD0YHN1_9FLAO|nr:hypothetical protein [Chryseobacterium shandongense]AZA89067.1 hypothetical protein EG349_19770 [Chryseobacterium shandongense]AZA98084.1 hypothetical protein EG353_20785 [Chryseobacterium shandongense]
MNKFSNIDLDEEKLADQTLDYILKNQNTCLESSLFLKILDVRKDYDDLNNHIEFLKDRLSHLKFIVDYDTVEFKNTMQKYQVLALDDQGRTFDNSEVLTPPKFQKERFSKEIFWANEDEERAFQKISTFNCFEDKIVNEKKFYGVMINAPFYNVKGWILYYQALLDLKFPEFSEKIVSGKTIIKYKPFKNKYFLGIETDYQSCKSNFRRGWWEEPEYKLIIFEKIDSKKIHRTVTFEKFVHPHFDPPVFSFMGFYGFMTTRRINEREIVLGEDGTKKESLGDGAIRIYNTEQYSDDFKRHAYFYYDMLYRTTREYLNFIDESFVP